MRDRPSVFLRIVDAAGHEGYGEIWCNFPAPAAEHRRRLAIEVVGPILADMNPGAGAVYERLMDRLHILAIQSGEWGPLRQVCAGLDAAVHDLEARRADLPLYRYLNSAADGIIRCYASGIGPENPAAVARRFADTGHTAFKVKVGFGPETDRASLAAFRSEMGDDSELMTDANQGWSTINAAANIAALAEFRPLWIEEPLPADTPMDSWRQLSEGSPIPIATGENLASSDEYETAIESGALNFLQPDVAKWGGVSGCLAVARAAAEKGLTYCPHFLGGGIGLLASAHLLAAAGGNGLLEIDTNPNPFRDDLVGGRLAIEDGRVSLGDEPGIGIAPRHLFE